MSTRRMTKAELVAKLHEIAARTNGDHEQEHLDADELLLGYINDPDVTAAFDAVEKWYS